MASNDPQHTQWRVNIKEKTKDVKKVIFEYYTQVSTQKDEEAKKNIRSKAESKISGLCEMFADNQIPSNLKHLRRKFDTFANQPSNPESTSILFHQISLLDDLFKQSNGIFDEIFNTYKTDGELNDLVTEIISLLNQIINDGEDHISGSQLKDLEKLISQLKDREKFSLNELFFWIENAAVLLLRIGSVVSGISTLSELANLIRDASQCVGKTKEKMLDCHSKATVQALNDGGMSYTARNLPDGKKGIITNTPIAQQITLDSQA